MSEHPLFWYRAAFQSGKIEEGTLRSPDRSHASRQIASRGAFVIELRLARELDYVGISSAFGHRKPTIQDTALAFRSLAALLNAGLPVPKSLVALRDIASERITNELPGILQSVKEGKSLSASIASSRLSISPALLGIIQAGEAAGSIPGAMQRAANLVDRQSAARTALSAALLYPAILLIAGLLACALLVTVVIPRFAAMFADLDQQLPAGTQAVLSAAALARQLFLPLAIAALAMAIAVRTLNGSSVGRSRIHHLLLRVPIVGDLRMTAANASFCTALGELLVRAINKAEGMRRTIDSHRCQMEDNGELPGDRDFNHHMGEICGALGQLEAALDRMGDKTREKWDEYVDDVKDWMNNIRGGKK